MGEHSDDDLLTRDEVAKRLKMSANTLRRLIEAGDFPRPYKQGSGLYVWTAADVEAHKYRLQNRHRFRAMKRPAGDAEVPPKRRRKERPAE